MNPRLRSAARDSARSGSAGSKPTRTRVPSGSPRRRSATLAAESRRTSSPHPSHTVRPARAKSRRRWSWISVAVATVERGLRDRVRCRIAIAGQIPSTSSTLGFSMRSRNWRA